MGSMTGAPKLRVMKLMDKYEPLEEDFTLDLSE